MVLFDRATDQMRAKIVYYGPAGSGKSTNLRSLAGAGAVHATDVRSDRLLSVSLDWPERAAGMVLHLELWTAPGDVAFNSTKQRLLERADGIVFVVDSAAHAKDANIEALGNLAGNLKRHGVRASDVPTVFQYNKRDVPNAVAVEELDAILNAGGNPRHEAIAANGSGVRETLASIIALTSRHIARRHGLDSKFASARGR